VVLPTHSDHHAGLIVIRVVVLGLGSAPVDYTRPFGDSSAPLVDLRIGASIGFLALNICRPMLTTPLSHVSCVARIAVTLTPGTAIRMAAHGQDMPVGSRMN
jgi:hypothetical protein